MRERLHEIDGLRGWAAVSVVVFHMLQQTFGYIQPGTNPSYVWLFMDGPMAVYIFLILSGDALSTAHVKNPSLHKLDQIIVKRYFRLTIPITIIVLATCVVSNAGWIFNHQAAVIVHNETWLGTFLAFPPSFSDALDYSLTMVLGAYRQSNDWNTFLWTIPVEMYGSLLVFSLMHVFHRLRRPMLTTLALTAMLACLTEYYALFFVGVLFALARASGILARVRTHYAGWVGSSALLVIAYAIECATHRYPPPLSTGSGPMISVLRYLLNHRQHILAVMIVAGCYGSVPMLWFLRSAVSRLMGRLSFALYIVQFPLLCSFESWLILRYQAHLSALSWVIGIAAAGIAAAMLAAELVTRLDNFLLYWVSQGLARLFVVGKPVQPQPPVVEPADA
jgi:peptidoglycan/LPS O-acetylase OafA/YrhL